MLKWCPRNRVQNSMTMFEGFNLRDNAFPVTPSDEDGTHWFGFSKLKQEFEAVLDRSSMERLRLCVLNRGRFGAGKTHAAHYFVEQYSGRKNIGEYLCFIPIIIESPKQPPKAFIDFSNRLFNAVTFRRIAEVSENMRSLMEPKVLYKKLLEVSGSEDIATVLSQMDDQNLLLSKTFLQGGGTARDLRSLGVAKRLTNEHEFASAVIGAIYLLIHGQSNKKESISRLLLWVDEMEDLVYFPTRYYLPFTQAIREVIDTTNQHMTLLLNFTFTEPEDLSSIENILGKAIMERVNQHIIFQTPSKNELKDYLLELFKANRLDKKSCPPTFPFLEDAFKLLIESAVSKTPRFLNKLCDMLLRDIQSLPGADKIIKHGISREIVEKKIPQILSLLEDSGG